MAKSHGQRLEPRDGLQPPSIRPLSLSRALLQGRHLVNGLGVEPDPDVLGSAGRDQAHAVVMVSGTLSCSVPPLLSRATLLPRVLLTTLSPRAAHSWLIGHPMSGTPRVHCFAPNPAFRSNGAVTVGVFPLRPNGRGGAGGGRENRSERAAVLRGYSGLFAHNVCRPVWVLVALRPVRWHDGDPAHR